MEISVISVSSDNFNNSYAVRFFESVSPETSATERILRQLYPDGPKCASCAAPITGRRALETFARGDRTYCAGCGCKFSPRANTILDGSHLTYSQAEVIFVLLSLGVDHSRIASMANVHPDTVSAWHSKIRFWESHA
jgi:hypothetical protein